MTPGAEASLGRKKLFLLDIDGTLCKGDALLPGAADFLQEIRRHGGRYLFTTNNTTRSTADYIRFFAGLGVATTPEQYMTAAQATIRALQARHRDHTLYLLATDSFARECRAKGLHVTTNPRDPAIACVVVAYDNQLTYDKIKNVCLLLTTRPVDYIATNPDLVCPVDFGYLPDCGSICNMLETATRRRPRFIGKPEPAMVDYALERTGCTREETLLVGDRLYTDILCGARAGVDTALVLSGEATRADAQAAATRPTFVFADVAALGRAVWADPRAPRPRQPRPAAHRSTPVTGP